MSLWLCCPDLAYSGICRIVNGPRCHVYTNNLVLNGSYFDGKGTSCTHRHFPWMYLSWPIARSKCDIEKSIQKVCWRKNIHTYMSACVCACLFLSIYLYIYCYYHNYCSNHIPWSLLPLWSHASTANRNTDCKCSQHDIYGLGKLHRIA